MNSLPVSLMGQVKIWTNTKKECHFSKKLLSQFTLRQNKQALPKAAQNGANKNWYSIQRWENSAKWFQIQQDKTTVLKKTRFQGPSKPLIHQN